MDGEGRLKSINNGSYTINLVYNALGQQVEQDAPGQFRLVFPYHIGGEKMGWYDAHVGYFSRYQMLVAGREVRFYPTNLRYYYHANHIGSGAMVTDNTGAAFGERMYYPYGQSWSTAGGRVTQEFAAFRDSVLGGDDVYVTPFRHYRTDVYRWLSPDPLAGDVLNPQSLNRYAYVLNNPANFIDPWGLQCVTMPDGTVADDLTEPTCDHITGDPYGVNIPGGSGGTIDPAGIGDLSSQIFQYPENSYANWQSTYRILEGLRPHKLSRDELRELLAELHDAASDNSGNPNGTQQTPQRKYEQCMADFSKTKVGKVIKFGSLLSFADDFWGTAKSWGEVIIVKTPVVDAFFAGANAAAGGVSPVTAAVAPVVFWGGLTGIGTATLTDLGARGACMDSAYGIEPSYLPPD